MGLAAAAESIARINRGFTSCLSPYEDSVAPRGAELRATLELEPNRCRCHRPDRARRPVCCALPLRKSGTARHRNNCRGPGRGPRVFRRALRAGAPAECASEPNGAVDRSGGRDFVSFDAVAACTDAFRRPLPLSLGRPNPTGWSESVHREPGYAGNGLTRDADGTFVAGARHAEYLSAAR